MSGISKLIYAKSLKSCKIHIAWENYVRQFNSGKLRSSHGMTKNELSVDGVARNQIICYKTSI